MMKHLRGIKRKLDLLNLNENWEKEKEELKGKLSLMTYLLPQLQAQMVVLHYQPKPRHLKKRKILDSNQNTKNTVDKENLSVDMMNRVMEKNTFILFICKLSVIRKGK
ncbi:hypothetical protein QE152_g19153 [Popillia japonica]|uniref:Uncharacterized protein n=1 Tax=Popillia japonica TaxID=7064 RepID=A0AAW1KYH6_POPJA